MMTSKMSTEKNNTSHKTLLDRYDDFCKRQEGKEFLWYSISFITLVGSIMPISLIAMYFTPWFFPYTFFSMVLFFSNVSTIIGRTSMKTVISVYLFTVACNIVIPALSFLLLEIV
ncbi:MAG: hypothetical protein AAGG75_12700 [Bacteroidota bacterium]